VAQFTLKSPRVNVLKILEDSVGRSNVFISFGAIARGEIESWMQAASLTIPSDLIEFWCQTGGGDLFDDSETMLRPTRIPSSYPGFLQGDDIESATQFRIQNGMPASYLLFHSGTFLSAIRLADQKFVSLDDGFQETGVFSTFEEWYAGTLRPIFVEVYDRPNED
jgi:hypothetical protein